MKRRRLRSCPYLCGLRCWYVSNGYCSVSARTVCRNAQYSSGRRKVVTVRRHGKSFLLDLWSVHDFPHSADSHLHHKDWRLASSRSLFVATAVLNDGAIRMAIRMFSRMPSISPALSSRAMALIRTSALPTLEKLGSATTSAVPATSTSMVGWPIGPSKKTNT